MQGPLPPYRVLTNFLSDDCVNSLLDHAVANQETFATTRVEPGEVNPAIRISRCLGTLGAKEPEIRAKVSALVTGLISELRVTPFEFSGLEAELVVHGDGAFYKRHIDTATGAKDIPGYRMISGVYYFNAQPKSFTGGALRLYAFSIPAEEAPFIDIEPVHNTLLVFPSWALHEVMPVSCPSQRFIDSRFAINFWFWRRKN